MAAYKIKVLENSTFGHVPSSFYLGMFGEPDVMYDHVFSFTLLQGEGKNILIDTGVDPKDPVKAEILKTCGVPEVYSPAEVLATVGVKCEDISDIILTHIHFDHAGGVEYFPNAKFYVQRGEIEGWKNAVSDPKHAALYAMGMDVNDIKRLDKINEEGRLVLLDGDVENLLPGISVVCAGFGHTFDSQMVKIETEKGLYLHMGDAANRPENLLGNSIFKFYLPNTNFAVGSVEQMVKNYDRVMEIVGGDVSRLIMTHDAGRVSRLPYTKSGLGVNIFELG